METEVTCLGVLDMPCFGELEGTCLGEPEEAAFLGEPEAATCLGDPVPLTGEVRPSYFNCGLADGVWVSGFRIGPEVKSCFELFLSRAGREEFCRRWFLAGEMELSRTGSFGGTRGGICISGEGARTGVGDTAVAAISSSAKAVVGVLLPGGENMGERGRVGLNVVQSERETLIGHCGTGDLSAPSNDGREPETQVIKGSIMMLFLQFSSGKLLDRS
jgi:hypothetical protein